MKKLVIIDQSQRDIAISRLPLGKALANNGFEVDFLFPEKRDLYARANVIARIMVVFTLMLKLVVLKSQAKERLTVLAFRITSIIAALTLSFLKNFGTVIVFTGIGDLKSSKLSSRLIRHILRTLLRLKKTQIDVIAQNHSDAKWLLETFNMSAHVIVGSGTQIPTLEMKSLQPEERSLLFVGRLIREKGYLDYIDIISKLRSLDININATIVGEFVQGKEAYDRLKFENILKSSEINWISYTDDMTSVYKSHSDIVYPSVYGEGFPRVIMEAMAHGLKPWLLESDWCKDGEILPYTYPTTDSLYDELTKSLGASLSPHEYYNYAKENFSFEKISEEYLEVVLNNYERK